MRLHILLPQRKGGLVNRQKLYRLDYELVVMVRTKRRRHKASHLCAAPHPTQRSDERWAKDTLTDSMADRCSYRVTVDDRHTRECLALDFERSMAASHVTDALDREAAQAPDDHL